VFYFIAFGIPYLTTLKEKSACIVVYRDFYIWNYDESMKVTRIKSSYVDGCVAFGIALCSFRKGHKILYSRIMVGVKKPHGQKSLFAIAFMCAMSAYAVVMMCGEQKSL